MKKFLSVLLLAAMVLTVASCGTEDTKDTTVATTTATPTDNGPKKTKAPQYTEETDEPEPEHDFPYLYNNADTTKELATLLEGLTNHADKVDTTYDSTNGPASSLWTIGFSTWNAETENIPQMFDGVKTEEDFAANGKGKIGGGTSPNACYLFNMTEKVSVKAYVITSGNDNATYTERNPIAWHLFATNDKAAADEMRAEGADFSTLEANGNWTDLDYVYHGEMAAVNFEENGYDVDADKEGEYQYFCWVIEYTGGDAFQICEFEIYG